MTSYLQHQAASRAARQSEDRANLVETHQKLDTIATARQSAGLAKNNAANQGVSDSSAAVGAQGAVQSQLAGNLNYLDQYAGLTNAMSEDNSSAQTFGDASSFAFKVFNNSDYIANKAQSIFD